MDQHETEQPGEPKALPEKDNSKLKPIIIGVLFVFVFLLVYVFSFTAPANFPAGQMQRITEGENLRSISEQFQEDDLIKSRIIFETLVTLFGDERKIIAGYYNFENPVSVFTIARRVARGQRYVESLKVTILEGFNRSQVADALEDKLLSFDRDLFLALTDSLEGRLFPDTYLFLPESDEEEVLEQILDNFEDKVDPLREDMKNSGLSEEEILIMASIIEREASGAKDRNIISGILWKRISIGMALQVDAWPDTYKRRGLPLAPIANPGLASIKAAMNPEGSPYLYYIHDKAGNTYYASSFDEHKRNIAKYLR